jgi:hypothetical protein
MINDTLKEEIPEVLQDYDIQRMVSVMRHIFLDYASRHSKHGLPIMVIENIGGIVILLDYLDGLEAHKEEIPA